jgi:GT2 family glycosyltransferase/Flp pilus assembly protein TadD
VPPPAVSIIIPVYNQADYTRQCLESILSHPPEETFEIIVVDDASTDSTPQLIQEIKFRDGRINALRNESNVGFAGSCNRGAELAGGKYLLFLNNDTEVHQGWFSPLFSILENNPDIGMVGPKLCFPDGTIQHCGKIWKDIDGPLSQPHHIYYCAPADIPCVNRSRDYRMLTGACFMVRRDEFLEFGPFDEGYENGWEDDDLCCAYAKAGKRIFYCAESTVIHHESKSLNVEIEKANGILATHRKNRTHNLTDTENDIVTEKKLLSNIEDKLLRVKDRFHRNRDRFFTKWKDRIERDDYRYYKEDGIPFVSIIIPVFNQLAYTRRCLESLSRNTPDGSYELIIVDNGSSDGTAEFLENLRLPVHVITNPENNGFARACNRGAEAAHGDYLLFLNNDTEPESGWLEPLVEVIHADSTIGATGSKLLFPDGTIQHAGVVIADDRTTGDPLIGKHIYYGKPADIPEASARRRYQALTAASLLVRSSAFFQAEGFDENYWNGYEDIDLCFKLGKLGYKLVYVPESIVVHHESKSGAERFAKAAGNIELLHGKWLGRIIPDLTIKSDGAVIKTINEIISDYTMPERATTVTRKNPPLVSIIILTFNQLEHTRACVDNIVRHTRDQYEIIFVDNGSTDGTVAWLKETAGRNDSFTLIVNNENKGFAAGCNQGIRAAAGEYVLLLNNDVVVTIGWLDGMLECLQAVPDTGFVGPMTDNISGIQKVPDVGYGDLSGLDDYARDFRERYRHRRIFSRRVVGFCMLFRRELVERIGYLDESFGSGNFEDDDYCLRAAIEGYRNVIAGDVFIHHAGSATFKGNNFDFSAAMSGNMKLFNEKWSRPVTEEKEAKKILKLKTLEKAENLYQLGEINKMIDAVLQEGIKSAPEEPAYYHALAEYFIDMGRFSDAIDTLRQIPEAVDNEKLHTLYGRALAGTGSFDQAKLHADNALRINPESVAALNILGVIAFDRGNAVEAATRFNKAVECDPGFGEAWTNLGLIELANENTAVALDRLERGFMLSPCSSHAAYGFHSAVGGDTQLHRAENSFREALRFHPRHRTIHFLLIDLLIRQGKNDQALEEIESACAVYGIDDGMIAAALELRRQTGPMIIGSNGKKAGTSVSLCMIMKDEEKNLPRCLKSLKPIVEEIIIVDTGSKDRSREVAEIFGAHVLERQWDGDFSAARNLALKHAKGDWILVMDADEIISQLDYGRFRNIVETAPAYGAAYDIVTRNYVSRINLEKWRPNDGLYPYEEAGAGWMPSNKVRLFPNRPEIRFENPIHEMVDRTAQAAGLEIVNAPVPVHHYGYLDDERQKRKGEEYYLLGRKKLEESGGNDFRALCELAVQAGGTGRYEEAVELWKRVLDISPDYPLAWFNMGFALLQLGEFSESRDASARAVELQPGYCEAVNNYSICEICVGEVDRAVKALEGNLSSRPDYPNSLVMLAVAHICKGDRQEGLDIFSRLASNGISFEEFINESVKSLTGAGKDDYARNVLEAAVDSGNYNQDTVEIVRSLSDERCVA